MQKISTRADYRNGYIGQATYIGKQILNCLDAILESDGPKPVILIQGDHGSKMRLDQESLERTDINECFPNLSSFYVPESVRTRLYDGITPVNTFRVLFDGLFGENYPLLPDKSWYSTFPKPYDFTDVTGKIADHTKMADMPLPKKL
jgi:hypothetical protein